MYFLILVFKTFDLFTGILEILIIGKTTEKTTEPDKPERYSEDKGI